ncbi:MAG TPA: hypothetical protein P5053_11155 [Bacteroidia bacterium]|nr:hypothetical protein [Bacteroidia bacterium]
MFKFLRLPLIMGVMLATASVGFAQTAGELKAEREQLAKELKSKDAAKIGKTLDKLAPVGGSMADVVSAVLSPLPAELNRTVAEPLKNLVGNKEARVIQKPAASGINSVDGLADVGSTLLGVVISTNAILQEYKTEIIENGTGEVDITKYKANGKDYAAILPLLVQAGVDAAKAVEKIKDVQADVKGLNPMQAKPAIAASNWAIDAVNVSVSKIAENTKLLQNLINTLKASGNL